MTHYLLAGRYRLTDRIAAGGMGEVWRAFDQLLNRQVAVKLLPTVRAGDESSLARFRAEARFAASLSHSGIARVYDYGESAETGGAYLVMELVDGEPLSAILARARRLSPDATLDIVGQAARALDAAHQAGIVHRDIKPGNILIARGGAAKITDFGIATAVRAAASAQHLTETGMVMGTAMYVSPEQATGQPVTAASDIYSLGVVAFECLAGRPPFTASEPLAIAYSHKHDPVPPLPPDVPGPVVDLVRTMLAKTPEGRPPSAHAVADRAGVLRDALALGVAHTRLDISPPGYGPQLDMAPPGYGQPGVTRADLAPAVATHGDMRVPGARTAGIEALGRLNSPDVSRRRPGSRRPLLAAGLTVLVCAIAAAVSFYLSGSLLTGKSNGDPGNTVAVTISPGASSPSASRSASPSASATVTAPGLVVHRGHKKKKATPTPPPSPSQSASPSASASPSPTASPSATASPTPTPTGTSSPTATPTATSTSATN